MEEYHKIQTLFKRYQNGPKKGKMIRGEWTTPELEYLAGNQWEFTEKVDGTNIRVGLDRVGDMVYIDYAGRTDRAQIPADLMQVLKNIFQVADSTNISLQASPVTRWMNEHGVVNSVLYGEGYGPKIQGGGNYSDHQDFVLFDVKIGDWWLDRDGVNNVARALGLRAVPTVGTGTLQEAIEIVSTGITFGERGELIRWGNGTLSSRWGNFDAEGIVARPVVQMFDRKGQRIITKIKKVDFR